MSKHVTFKLPTDKQKQKKMIVSIPLSKVSIPVSVNTTTGGIVVQVRKIEATVTDLQKDIAQETLARKDLQVSVEKLIADNAEAKTKIVNQINPIQHPMHTFMNKLPCRTLIELDELLAFIENDIRYFQLVCVRFRRNEWNFLIN